MKLKELEKIKDDISELFKDYKSLATIIERTIDYLQSLDDEKILVNDVINYIWGLESELKIDVNDIEVYEVE